MLLLPSAYRRPYPSHDRPSHSLRATPTVPDTHAAPAQALLTSPLPSPPPCRLLESLTPFGKKFSFDPEQGLLGGGEVAAIRVRLLSELLGEFSETFEWSIKGSSVPLTLQLKGHVAGPTFEVDAEALDFGIVSYGFRWVGGEADVVWGGGRRRGGEGLTERVLIQTRLLRLILRPMVCQHL